MDEKDFGKIALVVNEFGNLNGIVTIGNVSGEVRIKYDNTYQTIEPEELRMVLLLKQNEYIEEYKPLVDARDGDCSASWRERNLQSCISHLKHIQHQLTLLTGWQEEMAKKGG